jgi:hypothetical protein
MAEQAPDHLTAKRKLQQKYFKFADLDDSVPVFAFVGRIVEQKGVHLIVEAAETLLAKYAGKLNILVGGPANPKDPYATKCAAGLKRLMQAYPSSIWCAPDSFFMDGSLVNLGADFGLMPSRFEPGGIVQHEFFVGGTPVIAYKTGGLKDSVFEFRWDNNQGNGCLLERHSKDEMIAAMERALGTYKNKVKYKVMRENAFRGTMDGATVYRKWAQEFYRLRGKLFIDIELEQQEKQNQHDVWDYANYNDEHLSDYIHTVLITNADSLSLALEPGAPKHPSMADLMKNRAEIVTTTFKIRFEGKQVRQVAITGSWDNWKRHQELRFDPFTQGWFTTLHMAKGKYT